MLQNFQRFFCCSPSLPPTYQTDLNTSSITSSNAVVLPLSKMDTFTKNQIESTKELLYYHDNDSDVYSIHLNDIINIPSLSIEKIDFGLNHCLILLKDDSQQPPKTFLAGFGDNSQGQLGLDVYSKKQSQSTENKNFYKEVVLINPFTSNQYILDIAASNNFSLVLVKDNITKEKTFYRFELNQDELFSIGNFTYKSINPLKIEECPKEIVQNVSKIYAKNERIILQTELNNSIYIKGMSFHLDIYLKYKLFKQFKESINHISIGVNHCLILFSDNTLISVGHNEYGELGTPCINPKQMNKLSTFYAGHTIKKICSGFRHNLVLCEDGMLFAFGDNHSKQCLGDGDYCPEPKVVNIKDVVDIICGGKFSLAKNRHGEVFAWGECDFLFKEERTSNYCKAGDSMRLINDIKLKSIAAMFAGDDEVVFYAEKFN